MAIEVKYNRKVVDAVDQLPELCRQGVAWLWSLPFPGNGGSRFSLVITDSGDSLTAVLSVPNSRGGGGISLAPIVVGEDFLERLKQSLVGYVDESVCCLTARLRQLEILCETIKPSKPPFELLAL